MKSFIKKCIVVTVILFSVSAIFAQQHITNFGIVDTARIYEEFFRSSSAIKNYDRKKASFQADIDSRTNELRELQQRKLDYEKDGNQDAAQRVAKDIKSKSDFLKEYTVAKNMELSNLRSSLASNDEFYNKLTSTIKRVAENEGLSMVLSLQKNDSILWYSPAVDITDKVISELSK